MFDVFPHFPSLATFVRRMRRAVGGALGLAWVIGMSAYLAGCAKSPDDRTVLLEKGTLVLWAWPGYFPQELRDRFREETGYEIVFEDLPADEDLLGVLAAGERRADLIVPSAYVAKALRAQGYIVDFDKSLFRPDLLPMYPASIYNPEFDQNNDFVIPYAWGATGIGYDAERVIGLPSSWSALFSGDPLPPIPSRAWGHKRLDEIVLLDDARFTLGSVLLYQGKTLNTTSHADVYGAADWLVKLGRLHLKNNEEHQYYRIAYEEANIPELLRNGEVGLTMAWSADVTRAMLAGAQDRKATSAQDVVPGKPSLRIALPIEGSILFRDSFIIPKQVKPENWVAVHQLIEFMLEPQNAAAVTNSSFFATTVQSANAYVNRFILNGPSYFIHSLGKNQFLEELDSDMRSVYQEAWANVKNDLLYAETLTTQSGDEIVESATVSAPDLSTD